MNAAKRYVPVHVWRWWSGLLRTGVMLAVSLLAFPDAWALDAVPTNVELPGRAGRHQSTKPTREHSQA